jgi:hypothetical protein
MFPASNLTFLVPFGSDADGHAWSDTDTLVNGVQTGPILENGTTLFSITTDRPLHLLTVRVQEDAT